VNNKFDELTKSMTQSVTRRAALKKFSLGFAGMALACFGLANKAEAGEAACNNCLNNCKASGGSGQYCKNQCYLFCHKVVFP
jgi:hypothetical protein